MRGLGAIAIVAVGLSTPVGTVQFIVRRPPAGGDSFTRIYIDNASTDCTDSSGSGTSGDPYHNLYHALTTRSFASDVHITLKAGVYRHTYAGFPSSTCEYDGSSNSVMPVKLAGTAGHPYVIENEAGASVVIDGTDADINTGSFWTSCGATGWHNSTWETTSQETAQVWVDPPSDRGVGTRLKYNSTFTCTSLAAGEFGHENTDGDGLMVRLAGDVNPNSHNMIVSCEGGDCALHPVVFYSTAAYVTLQVNPLGGSFAVRAGRTNVMVEGNNQNIIIQGSAYTPNGIADATEFTMVMCGTRDYGSCYRVYDGDFQTLKNFYASDAMGEVIQPYGGGPVTGIDITNVAIENGEAYRGGLAWADGGYIGNNLGMLFIIKNCSTCTLRNVIGKTCYGPGINVTTSTSVGTTDGVTLDRIDLSDFSYQNAAAGTRTRAGIQLEPQRSVAGGAVKNVTLTNAFLYKGAFCDGTTFSTSHCSTSDGVYGLTMDDAMHTAMGGIVIQNNTFKNLQGAGIYADSHTAAFTLRNNIFDDTSTAGSTCPGPNRCDIATRTGNTTANNCYWATASGDIVIYLNGGTTYTRATATTFEASAVQSAPALVSSTNLHLQAGSPMIDAGTSTGCPTVDIDGETRSTCDVGADEKL